ncbi:hypothetical protein [Sodalis-like endosymbiont of Proechinophthirus fluctus]|uniref:hypothetical protein n=1 Tax=Sodalis-like endosymbiont of Proechinophthirus fluctus TaxID=1462730 RepID=UPI00164FA763|nr:hypothetical protein [Sodalis-like endosymbiont of Proechinophthirus fluctus]
MLQNYSRYTVIIAVISEVTALSVFTVATNAGKILYFRKVSDFNPGPDNVIPSPLCLATIIAWEWRIVGYLLLASHSRWHTDNASKPRFLTGSSASLIGDAS